MELTRGQSAQSSALRTLSAFAGDVFQGVPVGLVILDTSLGVAALNDEAARILGPFDALTDRLAAGELDTSERDWGTELRDVLQDGGVRRFEAVRFLGKRDEAYTLNISLLPLAGQDAGPPQGVLLVTEDVTRQTEVEKRLASMESMAAVGRLAARVAHELNNPLDGALRYINLCARMVTESDTEKVSAYLEQARQGLMRMAGIVGELLEFSRSTPQLAESGNINWVVEEALRSMTGHADDAGVIVAASFHDEQQMPSLEGMRLFQVCCNLIKNAVDAMPQGGRLTIITGIVDDQVVIRFEDTGVGLPPEPERVFEAFFTTKPAGDGTGLGLAICREYVEQLRGRISAESGKDKGAVFTIRIPVASCQSSS